MSQRCISIKNFSYHALERMAILGIDRKLVDAALASPQMVLPNSPGHPADLSIYVAQDIRVVVSDAGVVVTVGLNTAIPYEYGIHTLTNPPAPRAA